MKKCIGCKKKKNDEEFYVRRSGKERVVICPGCMAKIVIKMRYNKCKVCMLKEGRKYYKVNKKKIRNYQKDYRKRNKKYYVEYRKKWYEDNKDRELKRSRDYYRVNKDEITERRRIKRERRTDIALIAQLIKKFPDQDTKVHTKTRKRNKEQTMARKIRWERYPLPN